MATLNLNRDKGIWVSFLVTVLLAGSLSFFNLSEFVKVQILKHARDYPFGGEGTTPWYYKSAGLYAMVSFTFGLLFFSGFIITVWALFRNNKSALTKTMLVLFALLLFQIINAQYE